MCIIRVESGTGHLRWVISLPSTRRSGGAALLPDRGPLLRRHRHWTRGCVVSNLLYAPHMQHCAYGVCSQIGGGRGREGGGGEGICSCDIEVLG